MTLLQYTKIALHVRQLPLNNIATQHDIQMSLKAVSIKWPRHKYDIQIELQTIALEWPCHTIRYSNTTANSSLWIALQHCMTFKYHCKQLALNSLATCHTIWYSNTIANSSLWITLLHNMIFKYHCKQLPLNALAILYDVKIPFQTVAIQWPNYTIRNSNNISNSYHWMILLHYTIFKYQCKQ